MTLFTRKPKLGNRTLALEAHPCQLPSLKQERIANGKLSITIRLLRKNWQRWLGANEIAERTFVLDALGQEVYADCDGTKAVQTIVRRFAARHQISVAEAEISVTMFLKTLMAKGLVAMSLERSVHAQAS